MASESGAPALSAVSQGDREPNAEVGTAGDKLASDQPGPRATEGTGNPADHAAVGEGVTTKSLNSTGAETNFHNHNLMTDYGSNPDLDVDSEQSTVESDSTLGVSILSSTVSMSPSMLEPVEEHGRTYHKYKRGKYYLPNDEFEQDRLDLQHHLFLLCWDGLLYLAPVFNPRNVLDIGTGTGIWAMDFASEHPTSKVIGSDLSAIQPAYVPPNCQFEVDDAEDEWAYTEQFDYIHGRALFTCFKDPAAVFKQAYDALAPGGYFEMQDVYMKPHSIDGTIEGTALEHWHQTLQGAAASIGRDWACPIKYKQWFTDIGFENVVERKSFWPSNTWPKGQRNKTLGLWTLTNTLDGVVSVSTALLIRVLGMSQDQVDIMMENVRNDMRNKSIHAYYPVYVVYGRKPLLPAK